MSNKALVIALIVLVTLAMGSADAQSQRPVVLVFETSRGEGTDKNLAVAATTALKSYFRETERVDAIAFDRDSPTVLRAIMEHRLTADQVASYSSREERLLVAKILSYQYAAGAEISVENSSVKVELWLGKVDGGKHGMWETVRLSRAGGATDLDLDNAMQSAASAAVLDMNTKAFSELPRIADSGSAAENTAALGGGNVPVAVAPSASEFSEKGDEAARSGNFALAIQYYSQAVDADPTSVDLRFKLAEAYARKGMFDEAYDEIGRASMIGADADLVATAKQRVEQIKAGENVAEPEVSSPPTPMNGQDQAALRKMATGDALWRQGDPDGAAVVYLEAIQLNPTDWRGYERLAAVNADMSMFSSSLKVIRQLNNVQPNPDDATVQRRYELFRKTFDKHFAERLREFDSDGKKFQGEQITRQSYYDSVNGMLKRLDPMSEFLDTLSVPADRKPAHVRRKLACDLLAQALASTINYLETNDQQAKANADTFASSAKKELETAAKFDAGKAFVVQ